MKREFVGSNALDSAIIAVSILAWLLLIGGIIFIILTFQLDGPTGTAICVTALSIPFFITKAVLRGFESIVIASELYIEQMEKEKAVEE